ncbi:epithelial membrane protein 1-like [Physella acuta]|uniref:epithelial membrane protein 1-like n=1 Tax=Physella acuta TaxID=109671 RepID=UPI0027DBFD3A|nr:epithelial membrane protein 1-like [Physella acuta]
MSLPEGASAGTVLAVLMLFVGSLLHIIGLSTTEWSVSNNEQGSSSSGLWKECLNGKCEDRKDTKESIRTCGAMAILGMLVSFVAIGLAVADIYIRVRGSVSSLPLPIISAACSAISFVFIVVCIIIWSATIGSSTYQYTYTDYTIRVSSYYHYSFSIGFSFILSILGGIIIVSGGGVYLYTSRFISKSADVGTRFT